MKRNVIYWVTGIVLFIALLYGFSRLPGGESLIQKLPAYSLSPGITGMVDGNTGYVFDYVGSSEITTEELVGAVQRYLDRQNDPELIVARAREFQFAYLVEIVERDTGHNAFSMMVSKSTAQISPEAGPNLFWNTKYGSRIAEIGGGYGMLGRMLPEQPVDDMFLSESEARNIAQDAAKNLEGVLTLDNETSRFYGYYEFYLVQDGELVGKLDINGYSGQVWYKEWGTPQLSVLNLASN